MAMFKTKPLKDDVAQDVETGQCERGQQRLAFFKALRRLRNILEAEYWLLIQGVRYEEALLVMKKSMLFETLFDLEPEVGLVRFSATEMDELNATRELAAKCRALMVATAQKDLQ